MIKFEASPFTFSISNDQLDKFVKISYIMKIFFFLRFKINLEET